MKRISLLVIALILSSAVLVRAQDAAVEERLNKLTGLIQDLIESKEQQRKQIAELSKQISELREQISKPNTDTATRDELRKLADAIKEVDNKRIADAEKVAAQFEKLAKVAASPSNRPRSSRTPSVEDSPRASSTSDKGYEYEILSGDTLSAIAQAYREKGVKVTVDDILKANPGLKATSLKVGQKIFIPAS